MISTPKVSIVMPTYNAESTIKSSIESIIYQSYPYFELLIIDDGSVDRTLSIISEIDDSRLHLIRLKNNSGVSVACNAGLELARGQYIARTDADDLWLPERLKKGIDYLETHQDIGVIGSSIEFINDRDEIISTETRIVKPSHLIKWTLLYRNTIRNSTILARRQVFSDVGNYDALLRASHDYDIWNRIVKKWKIENMSDVLVQFRVSANQLSKRHSNEQRQNHLNVMRREFAYYLCYSPSISTLEIIAFPRKTKSKDLEKLKALFVFLCLYHEYLKKEHLLLEVRRDICVEAINHALIMKSTISNYFINILAIPIIISFNIKIVFGRAIHTLLRRARIIV